MRREIAYFDDENNAVGTLTTQLSDDARAVHQATGVYCDEYRSSEQHCSQIR